MRWRQIIERSTFNPLNAPEKFHHDRKLNFSPGAAGRVSSFPHQAGKINWRQIKSDTRSKSSELCRVFVVELNSVYRFDLSRFCPASKALYRLWRVKALSILREHFTRNPLKVDRLFVSRSQIEPRANKSCGWIIDVIAVGRNREENKFCVMKWKLYRVMLSRTSFWRQQIDLNCGVKRRV